MALRHLAGLLALALSASYAQAQGYGFEQPSSGYTYDPQSGNSYSWNRDALGNTNVQGMNIQNGTMWNQTIDPRGNQRGTDGDGNMWQYDDSTKTYINFGTGRMCTGEGYARVCN